MKCPNCQTDISYADNQLRDAIVTGIYDHDIQLELFGNNKKDMTLEEVYKFVEVKEAGKRSASYFHTQQPNSASALSSFKKQKKVTRNANNNNQPHQQQRQNQQQHQLPPPQQQQLQQLQQVHQQLQNNVQYQPRPPSTSQATPTQSSNTQLCNNCGLPGHGDKAPLHVRQNCCRAYNYTCSSCGKPHHFESVCRHRRNRAAGIEDTDNQDTTGAGALFTSLCTIIIAITLCTS